MHAAGSRRGHLSLSLSLSLTLSLYADAVPSPNHHAGRPEDSKMEPKLTRPGVAWLGLDRSSLFIPAAQI
jgi:hypothetical protein